MSTEDTNQQTAPVEPTSKLSENDLDTVAGGAGGMSSFLSGQSGELGKMETKPGPKPPPSAIGTTSATWSPTKKP